MTFEELIGSHLPHIALKSSSGQTLKIPEDLLGHWTLLYFYPKDDTPGCTKQACSYRDNMKQFEQSGIVVFGISGDDLDSHGNFISKFNLNFSLLADTELVLAKALGSYGDQEWQGKVYKGISRDTFLLSPDGIIRHIWRKVDPSQTVSETFSKVRELQEYSW